ncbi:MAG: alpha/beta family hydrolase [Bacteroidota bacterium]
MNPNIEYQSGKFLPIADRWEVDWLYMEPKNPLAVLVLSHGAGAGMQHQNMESIAQSMYHAGLAVFRFNFTYMQKGGGRESQKVSVATIQAAIQLVHKKYPGLPILVGGHSYGGRMTSHAAREAFVEPVKGLIYFAFPLHAPGRAGKERADHLTEVNYPQLFLSGSRDTFSTGTLLEEVAEDLGERATLHRLFTANHSYKILKKTRTSEETVFDEMGRVVQEWLKKVL